MKRRHTQDGINFPTAVLYLRVPPRFKALLQNLADIRRESLNCMLAEVLERWAVEQAAAGCPPGGPGCGGTQQPSGASDNGNMVACVRESSQDAVA